MGMPVVLTAICKCSLSSADAVDGLADQPRNNEISPCGIGDGTRTFLEYLTFWNVFLFGKSCCGCSYGVALGDFDAYAVCACYYVFMGSCKTKCYGCEEANFCGLCYHRVCVGRRH